MTATEPIRTASRIDTMATDPTVVACYSVYDSFFPALGFTDLTDGSYEGDPTRSYDAAQSRQAETLLNRARVGRGSRVLDIGCGYGRILRAAKARQARAWGITVSPEQVRSGRRDGLNVRLLDYKHLGREWDGQFDAVIANGSLEHFVQPADALAGRNDAIYRHLFATVSRVLDEETPAARFVTTAIHFRERPDPRDWLQPPSAFPRGSASFHFARLTRSYGGWYPAAGQLEACAQGLFRLVHEEDGTEDYRLTSEAWLRSTRKTLRSLRALGVWYAALPAFLLRPIHTVRMLRCTLGSESWNWQFRGERPPVMLLRQTWERLSAA